MIYGGHPEAFPMAVASAVEALATTSSRKWGLVSVWIICPDFLWEELWDLENTAYLSACLLLLITAGDFLCYF